MRAHPVKWYEEKYKIPRGEEIVMRCCSKEGGPVDYLIVRVPRLEGPFYKLYQVIFESLIPGIPKDIKLVKTGKDPLVLEDIVFGH